MSQKGRACKFISALKSPNNTLASVPIELVCLRDPAAPLVLPGGSLDPCTHPLYFSQFTEESLLTFFFFFYRVGSRQGPHTYLGKS